MGSWIWSTTESKDSLESLWFFCEGATMPCLPTMYSPTRTLLRYMYWCLSMSGGERERTGLGEEHLWESKSHFHTCLLVLEKLQRLNWSAARVSVEKSKTEQSQRPITVKEIEQGTNQNLMWKKKTSKKSQVRKRDGSSCKVLCRKNFLDNRARFSNRNAILNITFD